MDNDLISRQAAIDALDEYIEEYSFDLDENGYHNPKWCAMKEAKMTIQRLPSAERRGRWIINDNGTYSCSLCQSWIPNEQRYYARYCLYCGANMEATK